MTIYSSRPQNSPTNPILAEFRGDPRLSVPDRARDYLLYLTQSRGNISRRFEVEQIDHARRVLVRLAWLDNPLD